MVRLTEGPLIPQKIKPHMNLKKVVLVQSLFLLATTARRLHTRTGTFLAEVPARHLHVTYQNNGLQGFYAVHYLLFYKSGKVYGFEYDVLPIVR